MFARQEDKRVSSSCICRAESPMGWVLPVCVCVLTGMSALRVSRRTWLHKMQSCLNNRVNNFHFITQENAKYAK